MNEIESAIIKLNGRLSGMPFDFAFLGGSVLSLLITDADVDAIRVTKDVDEMMNIRTRKDYHRVDEMLEGWNWAWLLSGRPEFADRCDWKLLDEYAWDTLLKDQPRFVDKCPWRILIWMVFFKVSFIQLSSRTTWKMMLGWIRSKITGVPIAQPKVRSLRG